MEIGTGDWLSKVQLNFWECHEVSKKQIYYFLRVILTFKVGREYVL